MFKALVHSLGRSYIRAINKSESEGKKFNRHNERPIEFGYVFEKIGDLRPTTILDVGSGTTALPSLMANCGCVVTATDNVRDYWPSGMINKHWHVIDDDIKDTRIAVQFDLVTCISVIEHIEEHVAAFRGLVTVTKPGGHIIVTTPYNEAKAVPDVYKLPDCGYKDVVPYVCRSSNRHDLEKWLACGVTLVEQQYWRFWSGDVWAQGKLLEKTERGGPAGPHQLTCLLFRKS